MKRPSKKRPARPSKSRRALRFSSARAYPAAVSTAPPPRAWPITLENEKDLTAEYVGRRVLAWKDPAANVTRDVVDLMNEWYKKRRPPDTQPKKDADGG